MNVILWKGRDGGDRSAADRGQDSGIGATGKSGTLHQERSQVRERTES